jgi:hypothetical protein
LISICRARAPLIRHLRRRGIPTLVTTGYPVDTELSDELRDVPCLAKPYRASELMQRLRELVGKADQIKMLRDDPGAS